MAIKLRRGLDVERQTILFDQGEIVYCTDTKKVWIGDGLTIGGNLVTGDELLSGLDDVSLTTLADDNVLMYNQATSRWKNYAFADKVRAVVLTGISFTTNAAITATDTILVALGKIQAQINAKQNTITGAATTITTSNLTVSRAVISNSSGKVAVSATTDTELGYVSGVTSSIQTQLNGKQATIPYTTEDAANKSTSVDTDKTSDIKYPSVKSVFDWASGLFATLTQLATKQDTLVSGTNIKTINGNSILGSGNLTTSVAMSYRHDFNVYDYLGKADAGSAEGANVWTITRLTIASDGTTTKGTATNVAWSNRYSVIYT